MLQYKCSEATELLFIFAIATALDTARIDVTGCDLIEAHCHWHLNLMRYVMC